MVLILGALTIGVITTGVATIYFIFLIYFDWLRLLYYLPAWRQQVWVSLHLPLHLALVLFMQGFTQLVIWSKIVEVLEKIMGSFNVSGLKDATNATSQEIEQGFNMTTMEFFSLYPSKIEGTTETVQGALTNISSLPDSLWPQVAQYASTNNPDVFPESAYEALGKFSDSVTTIMSAMANALFATFGIDITTEVSASIVSDVSAQVAGGYQAIVQVATWERYLLVVSSYFPLW